MLKAEDGTPITTQTQLQEVLKRGEWVTGDMTPALELTLTSLTLKAQGNLGWAHRLKVDRRLLRKCDACGCPGYMHRNAEVQFTKDDWGLFYYEAGDIECENPDCPDHGCGWYEGDNYA